jgi:acyl carrier protein
MTPEGLSENILARVRGIIVQAKAESLVLQPEEVTLESRLTGPPLAMDSIDFVHMVIGIEEEFGIIAEDEQFLASSIETVADLVDAVRRGLGEGAA